MIFFIYNKDTPKREQVVIGILQENGSWEGNRKLEIDVRDTLRIWNLDLQNPPDRKRLLASFGGSTLFAIESMSVPEGLEVQLL